jgi:hypothetical protein
VLRDHARRVLLCAAFTAVFINAGPQAKTALAASQLERSRIFSVRLESSKAVYHLGELIQVRLTIRNDTGNEYAVHTAPPWLLCKLMVFKGKNQEVSPATAPHPGGRENLFESWDFTAGKSLVPGYYQLGDINTVHEWTPVSFWGYQLSEPGAYTLVAVPELSAREIINPGTGAASKAVGDWFTTSSDERSNAVSIRVLE